MGVQRRAGAVSEGLCMFQSVDIFPLARNTTRSRVRNEPKIFTSRAARSDIATIAAADYKLWKLAQGQSF